MTRRAIWIGFVGLLAGAAWWAGVSHRPLIRAGPAAGVMWHPVGTWSGHDGAQTGTFQIQSGSLRVRWDVRGRPPVGDPLFRLSLHSAVSGRELAEIAAQRESGTGDTYVFEAPRPAYVVIESTGVEWSFRIDEALPSVVK
jgi:hypothetical protein